jgi:hypothetical protein
VLFAADGARVATAVPPTGVISQNAVSGQCTICPLRNHNLTTAEKLIE